jgi:hypothetical protein
MPRTALTVQDSGRITPLTNSTRHTPDVANGNSFIDDGKTILIVINGGAGSTVLTVDVPQLYDTDLVIPNRTYTITAGQRKIIGPFSAMYRQTDNNIQNQVLINFDVSTSVTVEVVRVTPA